MAKHEVIVGKLLGLRRPYRRLVLSPGDPGPRSVTKLSGIPWWPRGIERPRCFAGHDMAFVAQFRMDEVPVFDQPPSLLSFHYCDECAMRGAGMSFGWTDRGRQRGYDVRVFFDLESPVDGRGVVAESRVEPGTVEYEDGIETPGYHDVCEFFPKAGRPGRFPEDKRLVHEERAKVGGWPSWVQNPSRPEDDSGEPMSFVAQLDLHTCPDSAWNTGAAFLFASHIDDGEQQAELIIQTS